MILTDRNQFFNQNDTSSSPGQYNPTPVPQRRKPRRETTEQFRFSFGTEGITQLGGYPLLENEFEYHDLRRQVHRHLRKPRGTHGFTSSEISVWQIVQKLIGCRRLSHADIYRKDPLLEQFFGIKGLPSDTTVGRYNRSFTSEQVGKLKNLNQSITDRICSDAKSQVVWHPQSQQGEDPPSLEVTLDVDGTGLTVYGDQQQAQRGFDFRQKDSPQYRLLSSFVGGLRLWVDSKLISGNYHLKGHGREMVNRARDRLPEHVKISGIRGDNALYNGEDIKKWVNEGKTIGITATKQKKLKEKIGQLNQEDWETFHDEDGGFICELAEVTFAPKKWDHGPYRYMISRRERDQKKQTKQKKLFNLDAKYDYFAFITNHEGDLLDAFQFVVGRCDVENCVKESKIGFDGKDVPHEEFEANRAYMEHVRAAYNLNISISINRLPDGASRYQRERLVRELIRVPARMIRKQGDWMISLPKWWPYKELARDVFKKSAPPPDG